MSVNKENNMNNGELDARVKLAKVTSDYTQLFIAVLKSIKAKIVGMACKKKLKEF